MVGKVSFGMLVPLATLCNRYMAWQLAHVVPSLQATAECMAISHLSTCRKLTVCGGAAVEEQRRYIQPGVWHTNPGPDSARQDKAYPESVLPFCTYAHHGQIICDMPISLKLIQLRAGQQKPVIMIMMISMSVPCTTTRTSEWCLQFACRWHGRLDETRCCDNIPACSDRD